MLFWGGQNELRNLCCHLPAGHLIWAIWWVFDLWNRDLDIVTRSRTQWGRVGGEWSLWVAWHPSPSRIPVCPLLISGLADPALSLSPVQVFDLVLMFMSSDLITFPWLLSGKIFWLLAFPWSQFHLEMLPSDTWGIWVIWSSPALRIQPWTWRWREAIQANYPQAELGVWGKRYRWGVAAIKVGQAELCWTSKYLASRRFTSKPQLSAFFATIWMLPTPAGKSQVILVLADHSVPQFQDPSFPMSKVGAAGTIPLDWY